MATGIVSTAAQLLDWHIISWPLFALNITIYVVLVVLFALRCLRHRDRIHDDFRTHARAAGFFTLVAGTEVLGTQMLVRVDAFAVALPLWLLGIALWVLLIYGFFSVMTVLPEKPTLDRGINASWMLIVVATQSVSLLGTLLSPQLGAWSDHVLGFTTGMFLLGCMFYILLFSLILYRFLFFSIDPSDMSPPYWINMGAVAITTLAGSLLVLRAPAAPSVEEFRPFLLGFTLLFWATATWWVPLLLLLGAWRHLLRRVPVRYDLQYWSMVFPLGMYAVATVRLGEALDWPFLRVAPYAAGAAALAVWLLAFVGLMRRVIGAPALPGEMR